MTYDSLRKTCVLCVLCGMLLVVSGCIGPTALRATRNQYNRAMSVSEEQQLLLNIVRVRYRETPRFLQVGAINATFDFAATASFPASFRIAAQIRTSLRRAPASAIARDRPLPIRPCKGPNLPNAPKRKSRSRTWCYSCAAGGKSTR